MEPRHSSSPARRPASPGGSKTKAAAAIGGGSSGRPRSPAAGNQKQLLRQQLRQMGAAQSKAAGSTARVPSPPPCRSSYSQQAQRPPAGRRAHALFYVRAPPIVPFQRMGLCGPQRPRNILFLRVRVRARVRPAFEQDDCPDNFVGAGPKGKHPNIICARLQTPLTVAQLTQALELFHRQEASLQSDPSTPSPFFFFDFDGTLTLADGLLQVESGSGSLDQLFGNAERRRTLQLTLSTLLQAGRCYVLTANGVVWRTSRRPCRIHGAHTPCRWSFAAADHPPPVCPPCS